MLAMMPLNSVIIRGIDCATQWLRVLDIRHRILTAPFMLFNGHFPPFYMDIHTLRWWELMKTLMSLPFSSYRISNSESGHWRRYMSGASSYVVAITTSPCIIIIIIIRQQCRINLFHVFCSYIFKSKDKISLREETRWIFQAPNWIRHLSYLWKWVQSC